MSRDAHVRLAHAALHPDRRGALIQRHGSAQAVLAALERGRIEAPEAARRAAAIPANDRYALAIRAGYRILVRGDEDYPVDLGLLPDAPDVLFCRGAIPAHPRVAVVGTRRCTAYGREVAADFGGALAAAGVVVVSGLAYGVDEAAHRGTVGAAGAGVAVLGCGIDRLYPASNAGLGTDLLEHGGAIVSEYPPGIRPSGWRFPPRNRIISGLSAVVVVVEAAATGGALITARYALAHGRAVFAVPGDVDRPSSEGTNRLIRDGAWPVFDAPDLLESIERVVSLERMAAEAPADAIGMEILEPDRK